MYRRLDDKPITVWETSLSMLFAPSGKTLVLSHLNNPGFTGDHTYGSILMPFILVPLILISQKPSVWRALWSGSNLLVLEQTLHYSFPSCQTIFHHFVWNLVIKTNVTYNKKSQASYLLLNCTLNLELFSKTWWSHSCTVKNSYRGCNMDEGRIIKKVGYVCHFLWTVTSRFDKAYSPVDKDNLFVSHGNECHIDVIDLKSWLHSPTHTW